MNIDPEALLARLNQQSGVGGPLPQVPGLTTSPGDIPTPPNLTPGNIPIPDLATPSAPPVLGGPPSPPTLDELPKPPGDLMHPNESPTLGMPPGYLDYANQLLQWPAWGGSQYPISPFGPYPASLGTGANQYPGQPQPGQSTMSPLTPPWLWGSGGAPSSFGGNPSGGGGNNSGLLPILQDFMGSIFGAAEGAVVRSQPTVNTRMNKRHRHYNPWTALGFKDA
jgi:hypothetical protein